MASTTKWVAVGSRVCGGLGWMPAPSGAAITTGLPSPFTSESPKLGEKEREGIRRRRREKRKEDVLKRRSTRW